MRDDAVADGESADVGAETGDGADDVVGEDGGELAGDEEPGVAGFLVVGVDSGDGDSELDLVGPGGGDGMVVDQGEGLADGGDDEGGLGGGHGEWGLFCEEAGDKRRQLHAGWERG